VDVSPAGTNVRTRVHEYGGAAHLLGPNGDGVIYSDFKDQRLYWAKKDGSVVALTPPEAYEKDTLYRFADAVLDVARNRLICIREDHTNPKPSEVVNAICALALDGSGKAEVLVSGKDFFAAPRLSPDGKKLAYICWSHPNMPWDSTQLFVADVDAKTGKVPKAGKALSEGKGVSVLQPAWSPNGELHFVADNSGWWNLYKQGADGKIVNLYAKDAEFSGAAPGWGLGGQSFCFLPDGRIATCYEDRASGSTKLVLLRNGPASSGSGVFSFLGFGRKDAEVEIVEFGQECLPRSLGSLCPSPDGKTLYFAGSDPDQPGGLYAWTLPTAKAGAPARAEMIVCSMSEDMMIDPAFVSSPTLLQFPTSGGEKAYGYYYAPANPNFQAPAGDLPPLLVKAHGGPTACARTSLSPGIQFWTSRGFAVLDVDYRGSTGYGREYRERLKGNWGIVDIEDVCAGAQYLVKEALANPLQLAIDGGSAGGFTTLGALTFKDVFTAGCSLYGVADLSALAGDTHKFESRYLDGLVGRYPEDKNIYEERAPIQHVEKMSCPILLLQGSEDKIVPPNQAEMMYAAVKARGLPCALKIYEGEQHGFRRSENIEDALNSELAFFARVFGFQASFGSGEQPNLHIANMDEQERDETESAPSVPSAVEEKRKGETESASSAASSPSAAQSKSSLRGLLLGT